MIHNIEEMHFIEDLGLFFEQLGMPRMNGRVLGTILISDEISLSLNDICDTLGASKSAVSVAAKHLVAEGILEPAHSPLPRRDYFRFKSGGWLTFMRSRMEILAGLHEIADRGLALKKESDPALKVRIEEAHDIFEFVEKEFPDWLSRMSAKRRQK
ncbi:MAG TPA: MarR family transcriptional regulator [Rectinemataceae bacterium]|nr:MarR family transcriptional regulator [Rectinemataceae bacterium]